MTDWVPNYLEVTFGLVAASAAMLLVGFVIAGILKVLIPEEKIYKHLGGDNFKSVTLASLFGIPLPLCSCSVLPLATTMKKSGASKGATASFLISSPETGVDSIGVTYALLDPIMTVMRPLAALISAILTGSLVNVWVRSGLDKDPDPDPQEASCQDHDHDHEDEAAGSRGFLRRALSYSFGPLLDDLTPWFLLGFLLSGVIAMAVPNDFFGSTIPAGFASSLLMLVVGTPIYICAAATTPVAAALIAKGLDPGAALVLLLVGPATNATTIVVVYRFLGKVPLLIYLAVVAGVALVLGVALNGLYANLDLDLSEVVAQTVSSGPSVFAVVSGIVVLCLLAWSALRIRLFQKWGGACRRTCQKLGFDPWSRFSRWAYGLVVILLYLGTSFSVLLPGEQGWVIRFGKVVRELEEPGFYTHLPAPFSSVRRVQVEREMIVEIGFRRLAEEGETRSSRAALNRTLSEEAEVLTGDEYILGIAMAVSYKIKDASRYEFGVEDPVRTLGAFAESALRQVIANRETFDVLITAREALEQHSRTTLQRELDRFDLGIEVTGVHWVDAHAHPEVHFEFQDVASAEEDMQRFVLNAVGASAESMNGARARRVELLEEAEGYRHRVLETATGAAEAFRARQAAYAENPSVTRLRLYLEVMEDILKDTRSVFLLGDDVEVELWNMSGPENPTQAPFPDDRPPQPGAFDFLNPDRNRTP